MIAHATTSSSPDPAPAPAARRGPVPRLIGAIAEPFYRAAISFRNRRFDAASEGDGRINRLPLPVVSIGNLSVGGTGKTPMVRWLARVLGEGASGAHRPMIALRGYRQASTGGISDEAEEYRSLLPGIAVAVGADRFTTVTRALATWPSGKPAPTVVLLDDGFQHRQLARDFDIVLIDATRPPMRDSLLPAGWLREGMDSLARAHAVIVTHAEAATPDTVDSILSAARAVNPSLVTAVTSHTLELPLEAAGHRVLVVSGIGNPAAFTAAVRERASVVGSMEFEDHAAYNSARVENIQRTVRSTGATLIVTTGKDAAKLARTSPGALGAPVMTAGLTLMFARGENELVSAAVVAVNNSKSRHHEGHEDPKIG